MAYRKEKLLKTLQVREVDVDPHDVTLTEINFKQGKSRGLTIVNAHVLDFFIHLNAVLNSLLSLENIHINVDKIHNVCRNAVDTDDKLFEEWLNLFGTFSDDNLKDEIFVTFVEDLYKDVTEQFIRISVVDSIKHFKATLPRKKKQALRTKVQALGERDSRKRKQQEQLEDIFICLHCQNVCEEEPPDIDFSSVGCDKCNNWFHYKYVNLTGNELCLKNKKAKWYCQNCKRKGKGTGKETKR